MAVDLIVLANYFDMLTEEAGGLSRLIAHAFTTPPSILIQNCAFLTIFLASCKILITSCHRECCIASTLPELLRVSDAEGPDDKVIGIVHYPPGEANKTAENPAFQPDNPSVIHELRTSISTQRQAARTEKNAKQRASRRAKAKAKKTVYSETEEDEPSESEDSGSDEDVNEHPRSSPIPPPSKRIRRILEEVTNHARPTRTRVKRKPQECLADVTQTFSAPYKTSHRRAAQS
ncbi:hypothetical protein B0H13DRAFT_2305115 [Mycena leptocephala]|nr:hypothetical protein B0H13DRAFT_2305115 [Mycena leptocephala]